MVLKVIVILSFLIQEAYSRETIITGSATKAWAGASIMHSRSAPSVLYNPANLRHVKKKEAYLELGVLKINYDYKYGPDDFYPQEKPVEIGITSPIPLYGFAWRQNKKIAFGLMATIIPGKATSTKVKGVIVRDLGDPGFKANIETGGEGFGIDACFGLGYSLTKSNVIGFSIRTKTDSQSIKVTDVETEIQLLEGKVDNSMSNLLLGWRSVISKNLIIALTIIPYRSQNAQRNFKSIDNTGELPLPKSDKRSGPLELGGGVIFKKSKFSILAEIAHTQWTNYDELDGARAVYRDTSDLKIGFGFKPSKGRLLNFAYGLYPSNLSDGLLASESEDGEELRGFKFGDIGSIAVNVFSLGYQIRKKLSQIQYFISYQAGTRKVDNLSPAFGTHKLSVYNIGGSYTFRF